MSELVAYLQSLPADNPVPSMEQIEHLINKIPDTMLLGELRELVSFASEKAGIYEAEWAFSPLHSPDKASKAKADAWSKLWEAFSGMLFERAPDVRELVERAHRLTMLQPTMAKSLELNSRNPARRLSSAWSSKLAIALNTLGLSGLASSLYTMALYPKGSVGRELR